MQLALHALHLSWEQLIAKEISIALFPLIKQLLHAAAVRARV